MLRGLDVDATPPLIELRHTAGPAALAPQGRSAPGVNYRRHIQEMGGEIPAEGWRPFFFLKAPTTTVIGPHDPIMVRSPEQARYDWEAELAVVIGVGGRDIAAAGALAHVAGYCVANDVTARGLHSAPGRARRGVHLRLVRGQVRGRLAAARPGHHPRVPGPGPAGRCGCGCG